MAFMYKDQFPVSAPNANLLHTAKAGENLLDIIRHDRIAEFEIEFDRPAVLTINGRDKLSVSEDTKMVGNLYSFWHRSTFQNASGNLNPGIKSISFDREVQFRIRYVVIV